MTSVMLPFHQPSNENGEEEKQSRLLAQKRNIELFWYQQMMDIHNISGPSIIIWINTTELKLCFLLNCCVPVCFYTEFKAFKSNHQLPLARIKRIMKSDKDVKGFTNVDKHLPRHFQGAQKSMKTA